jgi:hypothetical protein
MLLGVFAVERGRGLIPTALDTWLGKGTPVEFAGWVLILARIGLVANVARLFFSLWLTEDVYVKAVSKEPSSWFWRILEVFRVPLDFSSRFVAGLCIYLAVLYAFDQRAVAACTLLCYASAIIWDIQARIFRHRLDMNATGTKRFLGATKWWLKLDVFGLVVAGLYTCLVLLKLNIAKEDAGVILAGPGVLFIAFCVFDLITCREPDGRRRWLYWRLFQRKPLIVGAS